MVSDDTTFREACRVLNLPPDADAAAAKRAYRRVVLREHPDRGGDEDAFNRVVEAYGAILEAISGRQTGGTAEILDELDNRDEVEVHLQVLDQGGVIEVPYLSMSIGADHFMSVDRIGEVEVTVAPGTVPRSVMRLRGLGDVDATGRRGNLMIKLTPGPHPDFTLRGRDLVFEMEVTYPDLYRGVTFTVDRLGLETVIDIPPRSFPNQEIRLRGLGLGGAGDLVCLPVFIHGDYEDELIGTMAAADGVGVDRDIWAAGTGR